MSNKLTLHKLTPTTRSSRSPVATFDALQNPQYQSMRHAKKREEEKQISDTILKREAHERNKQRVKETQEDELDRKQPRGLRRSPTMETINTHGEIKIGKFEPPSLYAPTPTRPLPPAPPLGGKKARRTKKRRSVKKKKTKKRRSIKKKRTVKKA